MGYLLKLRSFRKAQKLTQAELANMIDGATERIVGAWERGETAITLEDAIKCAIALNCDPNDLCNWYEDHPRPEAAAQGLSDPSERELVEGYRACTPEQRAGVMLAVDNARVASKKVPADAALPALKEAV